MDLTKSYIIYKDNISNLKLLLSGLIIFSILTGFIETYFINMCLFGYICYKTIYQLKNTDIELSSPDKVTKHINILKHWCCFTVLIFIEYFLSFIFEILFMSFFYNALKIIFLTVLTQNDKNFVLMYDYYVEIFFEIKENYFNKILFELEKNADQYKIKYEINDNTYNLLIITNNYFEKIKKLMMNKISQFKKNE